ncbi:MAG TPA: alkaline phosphatase family protein [Gemmatimonadaceae bacterium]
MRNDPLARRVIVVILDGLRPDAIDRFGLSHLARLMDHGASTLAATTVSPSVTISALTSLMTGVSPDVHGLRGDHLFIPKPRKDLIPIPEQLARLNWPSAAFMTEVPVLLRGIAARIGRRLGLTRLHTTGENAAGVLDAARQTLRTQRRGLIVLHWPDADRAGHDHGWMSPEYGAACRDLDAALRNLTSTSADPDTLFIAVADHGGGGAKVNDHDGDHCLDRTIPIALYGAGVAQAELEASTLLDVPATILYALGLDVPAWFEGRVLREAFERREAPQPAVA